MDLIISYGITVVLTIQQGTVTQLNLRKLLT